MGGDGRAGGENVGEGREGAQVHAAARIECLSE